MTKKDNDTQNSTNRAPITIFAFIILALVIAAVGLFRIDFISDPVIDTVQIIKSKFVAMPEPDPAEVKQYVEEANKTIAKFESECAAIDDEFMNYINNNNGLAAEYSNVYEAIPQIANKFCAHEYVVDMISRCGSEESASENLEKLISNAIYKPCDNANQEVAEKIVEFAQRYEDASYALKKELNCIRDYPSISSNVEIRMPNAAYNMKEIKADVKAYNKNVKLVCAGVIAEAVFIRTTVKAIIRFGAKIAIKLGVSAGVALADGPLPIGDVLAIGGLCWTAWDIYELEVGIPKKFKKQTTALVDQNKAQMVNSSLEFLKAQKNGREKMVNTFHQKLKQVEDAYVNNVVNEQ